MKYTPKYSVQSSIRKWMVNVNKYRNCFKERPNTKALLTFKAKGIKFLKGKQKTT